MSLVSSTVNRIPFGQGGTIATLDAMERAVLQGLHDPAVVLYAQEIVRGIPEHDLDREIDAVFRKAREDFRYTRDPLGVELVKTPTFILREIEGHGWAALDCDDASVWLAALLRSVGIATRFKAIRGSRRRPQDFSHVYVEAQGRGGRWIPLDPIARDLGMGEEPDALFGSMVFGNGRAYQGAAGLGGTDMSAPNVWANAMALSAKSFGYGGEDFRLMEGVGQDEGAVAPVVMVAPQEPRWGLVALAAVGGFFVGRMMKKGRRRNGRRRGR